MSLTKQEKRTQVTDMEEAVKGATSVVFVAFDGLTVDEATELRDKLFAEGIRMRVMPKRLLRIVLQNSNLDFDPKSSAGQIAVVWGADPVAPAKVLHEFAKKHESISLAAGVLEKNVLTKEQVVALAKLPNKQELLGMLVGVLSGPMRGFASVLAGVPRATVYVLSAIRDQKQA